MVLPIRRVPSMLYRMNAPPPQTAARQAGPLIVFSTLLVMLVVVVAAILELGMAFLTLGPPSW